MINFIFYRDTCTLSKIAHIVAILYSFSNRMVFPSFNTKSDTFAFRLKIRLNARIVKDDIPLDCLNLTFFIKFPFVVSSELASSNNQIIRIMDN